MITLQECSWNRHKYKKSTLNKAKCVNLDVFEHHELISTNLTLPTRRRGSLSSLSSPIFRQHNPNGYWLNKCIRPGVMRMRSERCETTRGLKKMIVALWGQSDCPVERNNEASLIPMRQLTGVTWLWLSVSRTCSNESRWQRETGVRRFLFLAHHSAARTGLLIHHQRSKKQPRFSQKWIKLTNFTPRCM